MSRRTLNDAQWAQIADLVPGKVGDSGASGKDNRLFVDAVLWIARTSAPWRELRPSLGAGTARGGASTAGRRVVSGSACWRCSPWIRTSST
jgi:transposase